MLGAIAGDMIGSEHEGSASRGRDFTLFSDRSCFTDDSVCTIAVAHALRTGIPYDKAFRSICRRYPHAGYGGRFQQWLESDTAGPYNSFGNGSAMRVSPVAWAFDNLEEVIEHASRSAVVTHNHPEGVRGAVATAAAVFAARTGSSKAQIETLVGDRFGYDLSADLPTLTDQGGFDITCQGTVPRAIGAFLHSSDFEDAVRIAVSFGGDTDTLACIAGSIGEAFYGGLPEAIEREALLRLDDWLNDEVLSFAHRFRVRLAS
jgi:ADP-ribosylglycohydrolase